MARPGRGKGWESSVPRRASDARPYSQALIDINGSAWNGHDLDDVYAGSLCLAARCRRHAVYVDAARGQERITSSERGRLGGFTLRIRCAACMVTLVDVNVHTRFCCRAHERLTDIRFVP